MSKFYRVSFNYVYSSGKQINHSFFNTKELALCFALQIHRASNIQDVTCDLVEIYSICPINFCEELHGDNGDFNATVSKQKTCKCK